MHKNKLTFLEKIHETGDIYTFVFKPTSDIMWKPGQFIEYKLGFGLIKHFTIASAPYEGTINLTTRIFEKHSDFKDKLLKLAPGDEVVAKKPEGNLVMDELNTPYILIAGGIGITPFRAILWDLDHKDLFPKVHLLYASSNDTPAFKNEIDKLALKHKDFTIDYFLNNTQITSKDIQKLDINNAVFLISGPPAMVDTYKNILKELDIPRDRIKIDSFIGY